MSNAKLPAAFTARMQRLLGSAYGEFLASYDLPRYAGLRVNPLKTTPEQFVQLTDLALSPVAWAAEGFYFNEDQRPGKHPHYHAGLYYIQEPSAMAPGELLGVEPGHKVLDLCAAPGGKATQLAGKLQGKGLLVANDLAGERTKALAKNLELAGVRNALVLNEQPDALAKVFAGYFDRILVDAPCSGEGMFRKDERMIAAWADYSVERCAAMQQSILSAAATMLAPGGRLVYSTCTFSPEENEAQIATLLDAQPDMDTAAIDIRAFKGWMPGQPDWLAVHAGDAHACRSWSAAAQRAVARTARLWPHLVKGEGHYVALLYKQHRDQVQNPHQQRKRHKTHKQLPMPQQAPGEGWARFARTALVGADKWPGKLVHYGSRLYLQPEAVPSLDGLKVVRAGLYLGEEGKHRFAPSQALALALKAEEARCTLDLSADDPLVFRYLRGETLLVPDEAYTRLSLESKEVLVCIDGHPLGWGKREGTHLKNLLPAGWRWI